MSYIIHGRFFLTKYIKEYPKASRSSRRDYCYPEINHILAKSIVALTLVGGFVFKCPPEAFKYKQAIEKSIKCI